MADISLQAVKPEKALEYWKTRKPLTAREKRELEQGAADRAMTVAGLTRHRQLSAVYSALEKALDEGRTLADFKKEIRPLIEKQGWDNWRVENIFRTNLATAYAAGQWAEIEAGKEEFPYLEYLAVDDDRTRPAHAVLNGLIYPVDHEFWSRNYPPNGFGCRCTAVPVSKWQAEKKGLKIETEMPHGRTFRGEGGYPISVAAPGADQGFVGNAGRDWLEGLSPSELREIISFGPPRTVCPASGQFADSSGPCGLPLGAIDARHILPIGPEDILPSGRSEEYYAGEFLKIFGINDLNGSKVVNLKGLNFPLVITKGLLQDRRQSGEWVLKANKAGRGPYLPLMAKTILNPFEIWRNHGTRPNGETIQELKLIRLFQGEDSRKGFIGGFAVFRLIVGPGGYHWSGSTAFPPQRGRSRDSILTYLEKQRSGHLIFREE